MTARTSIWRGSPEAIERWAEHVSKQVAPFVQGLKGNAGAYFLIDRSRNQAMTLTLWESEEAALASDQGAEQRRARTVATTGVELVDRGRYEVVTKI